MRRVIGKIAIGIFAIWMFTSIDNWRYDSIFLLMGVLALCWLGVERTDRSDIEEFTGMRIATKEELVDGEDICPDCKQYLFRENNETLRLPDD